MKSDVDLVHEGRQIMRELSVEEMKHVSGGGNAYGTTGSAPAKGVRPLEHQGKSEDEYGPGPGIGNGATITVLNQ
jgi:hypothetical protein